ncbi:ADP-ribosylation factor-like protein 6-interacting protein 4 [Pholidichthys leucotaenia]
MDRSRSPKRSGREKKKRKRSPSSSSASSSSRSRSRKKETHRSQDDKTHRKKQRRRSSSSSSSTSSSSSSSSGEKTKKKSKAKKRKQKKQQQKKKKLKKQRKEKKKKKKMKKTEVQLPPASAEKLPSYLEVWQTDEGAVELGPVMTDEQKARFATKRPLTKEEYEARQSVIRKVVDPETGRTRLVRGEGEIIEEIVSRERHKEINKQATKGDGNAFQRKLGINR